MKSRGVTNIESLKDRCRVDELTGCWNWAMAIYKRCEGHAETRVHLAPGVVGNEKGVVMAAARASWLLSGKKLGAGQLVYKKCCNSLCVNPSHLKRGTRQEQCDFYAAKGIHKGDPGRITQLARIRKITTPERVAAIEQALADGDGIWTICRRLGVAHKTVSKVRDGLHPNCKGADKRTLPAASVFTFARALEAA